MQAPEDKEDIPEHVSETSSTGKRAQQSFVYPIRSLLGPVQPYEDKDIIETLLSRQFYFILFIEDIFDANLATQLQSIQLNRHFRDLHLHPISLKSLENPKGRTVVSNLQTRRNHMPFVITHRKRVHHHSIRALS